MSKANATGITITDSDARGVLTFDLRDVLAVIGESSREALWHVRVVECVGDGAAVAELDRLSKTGERINDARLRELAEVVEQVIDGTFHGVLPTGEQISIYAVDSTAFDVVTDRADVLAALRSRFRYVADIPN